MSDLDDLLDAMHRNCDLCTTDELRTLIRQFDDGIAEARIVRRWDHLPILRSRRRHALRELVKLREVVVTALVERIDLTLDQAATP